MSGIDEVARLAGVSTATVSRALSGRGPVSDATRARVLAAASELGYVVSSAASALASGRARNVGVVVPVEGSWFFAQVLSGIAAHLAPLGYDVTLYHVTDDDEQRRHLFGTSLRRGRVDGVITLSVALDDTEIEALTGLGLPVVGLGTPSARIGALRVDDVAVARIATEHLLGLGHRRIAHIGYSDVGDLDIPTARRRGFESTMADAGVPEARFEPADFTTDGGYRAAARLLDDAEPPTAIFAASDELAYGAIFAARDRGLRVPDDLSVVGVDGHELSAFFGLTTIDQFPHRQGERVAAAMLAALASGSAPDAEATAPAASLPFSLTVRTSTARPRALPRS